MSSATGTGWAQLRQQARSLETQTETLFHSYSQYASMTSLPSKPSEEEQKIESQLQDILERRTSLLSQLSRLLDSDSTLTSSALKHSNLSRHSEILAEHRSTLTRLKTSISTTRNRSNLLSNVRNDIDNYHSTAANNSDPAAQEADYMLQERRRLDNSHSMTDSVLSQAYAVNENIGIQRDTLSRINRRIVGAASQVPGINGLIGRIGAKRRRDGIIVASTIAGGCLFLFFVR
ncbi:MAG: Mitochondrial ATPase complex subunit atp10 [Chaenotheca gracillima]|nr:MAG: Mitochondrial ATPase complex subunit atp10 [Chaenotheca gracillima]